MTDDLGTLVLTTAIIPENGIHYRLEIRRKELEQDQVEQSQGLQASKDDSEKKKKFETMIISGGERLFSNIYPDLAAAVNDFYSAYAHPSAQEKLHGP